MGLCLLKLLDASTSSTPLALDSTRGYLMRRPWLLASVAIVRMLFGVVEMDNSRLAYLLVDEHSNDQDGDEENNNEDDDDTRLTLSPVLVTLGELVEGVLGASGDGHADGGHCGCRFLREDKSQMESWRTTSSEVKGSPELEVRKMKRRLADRRDLVGLFERGWEYAARAKASSQASKT